MPSPRLIVIEGSDDAGYTARVPDLPSFIVTGPTVESVDDHMREMLRQNNERIGITQVEVTA